jgi:hypothetical protein
LYALFFSCSPDNKSTIRVLERGRQQVIIDLEAKRRIESEQRAQDDSDDEEEDPPPKRTRGSGIREIGLVIENAVRLDRFSLKENFVDAQF